MPITDTDLINQITITAMNDLSQQGATQSLASFHASVCQLGFGVDASLPRACIVSDCAKVILATWQIALNSAESPDDVLQAIRRLLPPLEDIL